MHGHLHVVANQALELLRTAKDQIPLATAFREAAVNDEAIVAHPIALSSYFLQRLLISISSSTICQPRIAPCLTMQRSALLLRSLPMITGYI